MAENKVAPIEMEMENQQPEGEKKEAGGKEWTNPLEFLMTCISKYFRHFYSINFNILYKQYYK